MNKNNNQRKGSRAECGVPVDGKTGTVFDGVKTVDICPGGVGLISTRAIPLNEKIVVQLDLSPDEDPVLVLGQVKWVSKIKDSEYFRVGMSFYEDVEEESSSRLRKYFPE